MTHEVQAELMRMAAKYIWWEKPSEAVLRPMRVIAQVMNIGDFDDSRQLIGLVGLPAFREVMTHAEPGWFNDRSWHYWCYRLGIVEPGSPVPSLPERVFE
jgi:hypothetical protein